MTVRVRLAAAVLLAVATGVVGVPAASAGVNCTYYRWDESTRTWYGVYPVLNDRDIYEAGHTRFVDWWCRYCGVETAPGGTVGTEQPLRALTDDPVHDALVAESRLTRPVWQALEDVGQSIGVWPWDYPPCPSPAPPPNAVWEP